MQKHSQPTPEIQQQVNDWILAYQQYQDEDAQTQLVLHYEALVKTLARKYSRGNTHHEDMVQVGMLGLLGAIRRYDPSFGRSFEAFLIPTVIGEIKKFLRDKVWSVHVPRRVKESGLKIQATVDELTTILNRSPRIEEIAQHLDMTEEDVLEAMESKHSFQALSVDHSLETDSEGGSLTLLDVFGTIEQGFERVDERLLLEKALPILTEQEREILQFTYFDNQSQAETGRQLGISQMHVSRIQRRAIKRLQQFMQTQHDV